MLRYVASSVFVLLTSSCSSGGMPDAGEVCQDAGCGHVDVVGCPDGGDGLVSNEAPGDGGCDARPCSDGGLLCTKTLSSDTFDGLLFTSDGHSISVPVVLPMQDHFVAFAYGWGVPEVDSGLFMFESSDGLAWSQGERVFDRYGVVIFDGSVFQMWYNIPANLDSPDTVPSSIGYATSATGSVWVDFGEILVGGQTPNGSEGFPLDIDGLRASSAWFDGLKYHLFFQGISLWSNYPPGSESDDFSFRWSLGHASGTSPDQISFNSWIVAADRCPVDSLGTFEQARIRQSVLPLCPGGNDALRAVVWMQKCDDTEAVNSLVSFDGVGVSFEPLLEWPSSPGTALFSNAGAWTYEANEDTYSVSLRPIDIPLPAVVCE